MKEKLLRMCQVDLPIRYDPEHNPYRQANAIRDILLGSGKASYDDEGIITLQDENTVTQFYFSKKGIRTEKADSGRRVQRVDFWSSQLTEEKVAEQIADAALLPFKAWSRDETNVFYSGTHDSENLVARLNGSEREGYVINAMNL